MQSLSDAVLSGLDAMAGLVELGRTMRCHALPAAASGERLHTLYTTHQE